MLRKRTLTTLLLFSVLALAPSAALAAAPANDDFDHGLALTLPSQVTGTQVDATLETGEPATSIPSIGRSVWYELTATTSERLRIDTCGSDAPAELAVYTGTSVTSLNEVAQSTYNCNGGARVYVDAVVGTTYHVRVAGATGAPGTIVLTVARPQAPANDDFADAIALTPPDSLAGMTVNGTTVDATTQSGEVARPDDGDASVWYRVIATTRGPLDVSSCATSSRPAISIYTGSGLGSLTEVGDIHTLCGPRGRVSVTTTPGATYYVAVRSVSTFAQAFTLNVIDQGSGGTPGTPGPAPPSPTCPFQLAAPGSVTYRGTHSGGGEVCLTVRPDFSGVSWFSVLDPPPGCDLPWAVERFDPALAIVRQRFAMTTASAVLEGAFVSSRTARGTIQLTRPTALGICRTAVVTWQATTAAATPFPDPDITAPALRLGGATVQRPLRRNAIVINARCPKEACTVRATAKVAGRTLRSAARKIRADQRTTLRIALPTRTRHSLRSSLRSHASVRVRVRVTARDAAGNHKTRGQAVKLRR